MTSNCILCGSSFPIEKLINIQEHLVYSTSCLEAIQIHFSFYEVRLIRKFKCVDSDLVLIKSIEKNQNKQQYPVCCFIYKKIVIKLLSNFRKFSTLKTHCNHHVNLAGQNLKTFMNFTHQWLLIMEFWKKSTKMKRF
jgi:hypothetical protein